MKRAKSKSHGGRASALPSVSLVAWKNSSRLIPSKYSIPDESVLTNVAPDQELLDTAFELDNLTNDRLRAEQTRMLERPTRWCDRRRSNVASFEAEDVPEHHRIRFWVHRQRGSWIRLGPLACGK